MVLRAADGCKGKKRAIGDRASKHFTAHTISLSFITSRGALCRVASRENG
jgi:hypothetical protein